MTSQIEGQLGVLSSGNWGCVFGSILGLCQVLVAALISTCDDLISALVLVDESLACALERWANYGTSHNSARQASTCRDDGFGPVESCVFGDVAAPREASHSSSSQVCSVGGCIGSTETSLAVASPIRWGLNLSAEGQSRGNRKGKS